MQWCIDTGTYDEDKANLKGFGSAARTMDSTDRGILPSRRVDRRQRPSGSKQGPILQVAESTGPTPSTLTHPEAEWWLRVAHGMQHLVKQAGRTAQAKQTCEAIRLLRPEAPTSPIWSEGDDIKAVEHTHFKDSFFSDIADLHQDQTNQGSDSDDRQNISQLKERWLPWVQAQLKVVAKQAK